MRVAKDGEGKAEHVLPAFCGSAQTVPGHDASARQGPRARAKGLEIPDALD